MRSRHPTGGYGNAGVTARRPLPCPHFHNAPSVRLGGKGLLGYYSFSRSRAFYLRNFINSAFVLTFLDWDRLTLSSIFRIRSLMLFSILSVSSALVFKAPRVWRKAPSTFLATCSCMVAILRSAPSAMTTEIRAKEPSTQFMLGFLYVSGGLIGSRFHISPASASVM